MKKIFLTVIISITILSFISAQNFNLQFRSEVLYNSSCASIWGYVLDEREYALVGTAPGVSIVDVTDPDNPDNLFDVLQQGTYGLWREIKTYTHYAYATNETGNGILIIDLQYLPDSIKQYEFIYDPAGPGSQTTGHTLWIDEKGRLFVFGGNYKQGYTCFDLTVDPLNPPFLGGYDDEYIHDGFVRGDTLWAGEISAGQIEAMNVSDPDNPVFMASWHTPNNFSHNCWPTHDNHYVFTTDEVDNSYLTSYDVSDFGNITELDRVQSNPGSGTIIHNVHLYNDQFAVTAYYKDGVVIFDVLHPDNMIEVASYDTDPGESGGGYGGTWGVYPYLPSGNIIASYMYDNASDNGKLTVLTPTYVAACWLQGTVTDSVTGALLNNVFAEIETTQNSDLSDLSGVYKTGNGIAGTYTVRFSKPGYLTKEIQNVTLTSGVQTILDVQLASLPTATITGQVIDSVTNDPIQDATVYFISSEGFEFTEQTDGGGNFTFSGYESTYDIYAGKWSYFETGLLNVIINLNPAPFLFKLNPGYYDDFILDLGWEESHTSTTGFWTRCEPKGTYSFNTPINPETDIAGDWGDHCYVTGNGGGGIGDDDVDNGSTTLTSPVFDLTNYSDATVKFYAWFANTGGQGSPNDTLDVYITDGNSTVLVLQINEDNFSESEWNYHEFHVNDFIVPNATMQMKFKALDKDPGHVTEAGIDYFRIDDELGNEVKGIAPGAPYLSAYPNPFSDQSLVTFDLGLQNTDASIDVYDVLGNKLESHPVKSLMGSMKVGRNLCDGVYLVHLVEQTKTTRVVKMVKVK
ncbi:MAG: choice-of-anchor B family protein [Chitinophagales bacterium]